MLVCNTYLAGKPNEDCADEEEDADSIGDPHETPGRYCQSQSLTTQ